MVNMRHLAKKAKIKIKKYYQSPNFWTVVHKHFFPGFVLQTSWLWNMCCYILTLELEQSVILCLWFWNNRWCSLNIFVEDSINILFKGPHILRSIWCAFSFYNLHGEYICTDQQRTINSAYILMLDDYMHTSLFMPRKKFGFVWCIENCCKCCSELC